MMRTHSLLLLGISNSSLTNGDYKNPPPSRCQLFWELFLPPQAGLGAHSPPWYFQADFHHSGLGVCLLTSCRMSLGTALGSVS